MHAARHNQKHRPFTATNSGAPIMTLPSISKRLFSLPACFAISTLLVVLASVPAAAQTAAVGNITGTVTDTTGAAVPNANVVVTNSDTGVSRIITTNGAGEYSAPF